jgi:hypothetical protein
MNQGRIYHPNREFWDREEVQEVGSDQLEYMEKEMWEKESPPHLPSLRD